MFYLFLSLRIRLFALSDANWMQSKNCDSLTTDTSNIRLVLENEEYKTEHGQRFPWKYFHRELWDRALHIVHNVQNVYKIQAINTMKQ